MKLQDSDEGLRAMQREQAKGVRKLGYGERVDVGAVYTWGGKGGV